MDNQRWFDSFSVPDGGRPAQLPSRRQFLRGMGLTMALGAGATLLAACGGAQSAAGQSGAASSSSIASPAGTPAATGNASSGPRQKLQLPSYVPAKGPAPDVPGTDVIPDGYAAYPKTPVQTVPHPPGSGGDVTVVGETFNPLAPLDHNTLWQQLNKELNVNLKLNLVPFADYGFGKFQTIVAGGDLPDLLFVPVSGTIPDLPSFLEAKMQDLTPFVGGDAVKEWPNLASLPTVGWKGVVYDGKVFGVPVAQSLFYWGLWGRQEVLEQNHLEWPKSADDFKRVLVALTHPEKTQFGIGFESGHNYAYGLTPVGGSLWPAIFGAPNNWGVSADGKFTKDWETEQFRAAVGLAREVFAAGAFDPATNYNTTTADGAFQTRRMAFRFGGALNVNNYDSGTTLPDSRVQLNPPGKARLAPPIPAQAGGKGQYNYGIGKFGFVMLKKAPAARIKELLSILNYMVAPFGSQEYLTVNYGVMGTDYELDANGNPVPTKQGTANQISWFGSMGRATPVLFDTYNKDFAAGMNASLKPLAAVGRPDPTVGLYSPLNQKEGFLLQQKFSDGLIDIVANRAPLSSFDGLVKTWQSAGGNQIRQELQQAYAASR